MGHPRRRPIANKLWDLKINICKNELTVNITAEVEDQY